MNLGLPTKYAPSSPSPAGAALRLVAAATVAALLAVRPAAAGALDLANTTVITGSDGEIYSAIGNDMQTTGVRVAGTQQGSSYTLSLTYQTTFDGTAVSGAVTAHYADIFLRVPGAGYSAQPFGLAISLGDQAANGGIAAGLYVPTSIATAADIWASRSAYVYGAGYGAGVQSPMFVPPTVLTGGTEVPGSFVSVAETDTGKTLQGQELYRLQVSVSGLSFAMAEALNGGFDAFWGTADCANGAFLAGFDPATPFFRLPAPGSLGLFAVSCLATLGARRRARR